MPQLLGNLAMLQDFRLGKPGVWVDTFMNNLPLWSLSYEWAFYLLFFPLWRWVPREHQLPGVTLVSLIAWMSYVLHPNHASLVLAYFVIWWTGLEMARAWVETGQLEWTRCRGPLLALATMSLAGAVPVVLQGSQGLGIYPVLTFRHFTAALAFALLTIAWSKAAFAGYRWTIGPFQPLAGISYAIYVLHYPIMVVWGVESGSTLTLLGASLPTLLLSAWLIERPGQKLFNSGLNRMLGITSAR